MGAGRAQALLLLVVLGISGGTPPANAAACPSRYGPGEHSIRMSIPAAGVTWEREFVVSVPASLPMAEPRPSVIMWHGCGSDIEKFKLESGVADRIDAHGYYSIWPRGTSSNLSPDQQHTCRSGPADPAASFDDYTRCGWNSGFPNDGGCQTPDSPRPDDVDFAERILDFMDTNLCIDTQRTFIAGFSNGAQMAYKLK